MNNPIICPKCHEANEPERSFCWICYQPFGKPVEATQSRKPVQLSNFPDNSPVTKFLQGFVKVMLILSGLVVIGVVLFIVILWISCSGKW